MSPDATANPGAPATQDRGAIGADAFAEAYARTLSQEDNPDAELDVDEEQAAEDGPEDEEALQDGEEEPETDDDTPEPPADEPRYEVPLKGGLKVKVPVSELIQGYQRQKDYTQKTMELSEHRKVFEQEASQAREQQEKAAEFLLSVMDRYVQPEEEPDWRKIAAEEPHLFQEKQADWLARRAERERAAADKQALQQELERRKVEERKKRAQEQAHRFVAKSGLKPEQAAKAYDETMRGVVEKYGFTKAELEVLDGNADLLLAMRDALAYRSLKEGKPGLQKQIQAAPRLLKPGQPRSATATLAERMAKSGQQLARTGSRQDFAEWFATREAARR